MIGGSSRISTNMFLMDFRIYCNSYSMSISYSVVKNGYAKVSVGQSKVPYELIEILHVVLSLSLLSC